MDSDSDCDSKMYSTLSEDSSTDLEGNGDHVDHMGKPFNPQSSITSLDVYMEERMKHRREYHESLVNNERNELSQEESNYSLDIDQDSKLKSISSAEEINKSIEIFFGNLTTFGTFSQSLSDCGFRTPRTISDFGLQGDSIISEEQHDLNKTTVNPGSVKKLCLVGHPLTSFKGLNSFKKLSEAWVTNCSIKELKWKDFEGLEVLHRLYLFGGHIATIEPLYFSNLKVLWLSGNKLTSLDFLTDGLSALVDLNVANNQITCLDHYGVFQCSSLEILNVAGNPICTIQDVTPIGILPNLKSVFLVDPIYGSCPVTSFCESRTALLNSLPNVERLSGEEITEAKRIEVERSIAWRCMYYFVSLSTNAPRYFAVRHAAMLKFQNRLEVLDERICILSILNTRCLQADYYMASLPMFAKTKTKLLLEVHKIHGRLGDLKLWTKKLILRCSMMLFINRWEQKIEQWLKWMEYKTCGAIYGQVALGILDSETVLDAKGIRETLHQVISSLSCTGPWPEQCIIKIESVVVLQDKGAEEGMSKTFEHFYAKLNEPKFIPPPPEELDPLVQDFQNSYPFYGPPSIQPMRIVPTYTDPDYKPQPPWYPYPESVPGLPERSRPLMLFLVCKSSKIQNDPLLYLQTLMKSPSTSYKDVRLTNCMWSAVEMSEIDHGNIDESVYEFPNKIEYSILCVVKVLNECLKPIGIINETKKHSNDCQFYELTKPLCYAPAYLVFISYSSNDKGAIWFEGSRDDVDVMENADSLLEEMSSRVADYRAEISVKTNSPYYLYKIQEGVKADLTAVTSLVTNISRPDPRCPKYISQTKFADISSVRKFLGPEIAPTITSLDLCQNQLNRLVEINGLINLKKLNLSHNNLTNLSNLPVMPQLKELKTSWNRLRSFNSSIASIAFACKNLTSLEILPNPLQDIKDFAHLPLLAQYNIPSLVKVDLWTSPFQPAPLINISKSEEINNIELVLTKEAMSHTYAGHNTFYSNFKGRCLIHLGEFPSRPKLYEKECGLEVDLSDNYLTSTGLCYSPLVHIKEWKLSLVKLQLQENSIANLRWMGELQECTFPNLKILNLSNNLLMDITILQYSCPVVEHLYLSSNNLPCNVEVLNPLRCLRYLQVLDLSRNPISTTKQYGPFVMMNLRSVQILDGIAITDWVTDEFVDNTGGTLNLDWIDKSIGCQNWRNLTSISFPNCKLKYFALPTESLPNLLTLNLSGNHLTSLSGLGHLRKLRVLSVSCNKVSKLGETCPKCFENTITAKQSSLKGSKSSMFNGSLKANSSISALFTQGHKFKSQSMSHFQAEIPNKGPDVKLNLTDTNDNDGSQQIFPSLEILVLSHNGISSLSDLHLHALPNLKSVAMSCNQIKGMDGMNNLKSIKVILLDNNRIEKIPFNSLMGCKSLKHLHLEHNKISNVPRLPHLANLTALYLAYNRIQSLTDVNCLGALQTSELTLVGNPAAYRMDYYKNIRESLPQLIKLDGTNLIKLQTTVHLEEIGDLRLKENGKTISELKRSLKSKSILPKRGIKFYKTPQYKSSSRSRCPTEE